MTKLLFILVPCTYLNRQHQVCVARFDKYPYEDILARAYKLRIIQIADHPEDCVYPCCKHCIRPGFARDTVYPSHWYRWTGLQQDIPLHWSEQEHDQFLHSPAEYMDTITNAIHIMYMHTQYGLRSTYSSNKSKSKSMLYTGSSKMIMSTNKYGKSFLYYS